MEHVEDEDMIGMVKVLDDEDAFRDLAWKVDD